MLQLFTTKVPICQLPSTRNQEALLLSLILSGFLLLGCRKSSTEEPLKVATTGLVDPLLLKIIERINSSDNSLAFFNKLIDTYGQAHWDHAVTGKRAQELVCLVPFSQTGQRKVTAVLAIELGTHLRCRVLEDQSRPLPRDLVDTGRINRTIHLFNYLLWEEQSLSKKGIWFNTTKKQGNADDKAVNWADVLVLSFCYDWMSCTGDGAGNCVGNITYHSDCITEIIWTKNDGYNGGGGGFYSDYGGGSGGGGGSQSPTASPEQVMEPPRLPIADINSYLACFIEGQPATLVVYADQPSPGTNEPVAILGGLGHAFVAIEQTINGNTIRRTVGFYPEQKVNPFNATSSASALGDDQTHIFDVSLSQQLSPQDLSHVLNAIRHYAPSYDLENYNCVDFVLDVTAAGGLDLPRTSGWWVVGRGRNPGAFGEDLRQVPGSIFQTGNAPFSLGSCP